MFCAGRRSCTRCRTVASPSRPRPGVAARIGVRSTGRTLLAAARSALNRLGPMQRRLLYSTVVVLLASGVYWALVHYAGVRPYLSEPLLMKIHGAAAMAALIVIGGLLAFHVPGGWA